METFSRLINKRVDEDSHFQYHWRCAKTRMTHLIFADDLMIFCGKSLNSANVIKSALDDFSEWSGLKPNMQKSQVYLAGTDSDYMNAVQQVFNFQVGTLPVKYLGIPLVSTRISNVDCKPLIDSMVDRIKGWTVRWLSFAGRLQLIKSILSSANIFWASHMILPKKIINKAEQIMREFLWKGQELGKGGAKVAWKDVARPLKEGGLGIKRLADWNKAAMAKCLWNLAHPGSTSEWARWAKANLLKGRSLWDIKVPQDCSWTWRKVLSLRHKYRPYIKMGIGNGSEVSLWFDHWLPTGPLHSVFGEGPITDTGMHRYVKASALFRNGRWRWPWTSTADIRAIQQVIHAQPALNGDEVDTAIWDLEQNGKFSIRSAWECIRAHSGHVDWYKIIWFTGKIPKAAFCLWLATRERLYTQDRIINADPSWNCLLCGNQRETHSHLFFRCIVSKQLWRLIQAKGEFSTPNIDWASLMIWISKEWRLNNLKTLSWKLSLAATVYHIWAERNHRLHNQGYHSAHQIAGKIEDMVKMKLSTLKGVSFNQENRETALRWNIHTNIFKL